MRKVLIAAGVGVVAIIIAIVVFFVFIRSDAPDAFELSTDPSEDTTEDSGPVADSPDTESPTPGNPDGTWSIGEGSQAGYRVIEDFAGGLQDFEAVGRGSGITGSITISGTTITAASFEIEIVTITSDDDLRDSKFAGSIMNAEEFPTAKFVLTEPIKLGEEPAANAPISATATGDLTLRGVTNSAPVTIDAQLIDDRIEIVGSLDVLFSDYGIANPSIERIIAVRDEGVVEFQLFLVR